LTYPVTATQVLYRTRNTLGDAVASVATVIRPSAPSDPAKIASYQIAYDCTAAYGRPSFQLNAGLPDSGHITAEIPTMLSYLADGWTVVTADYEGPPDDYTAGPESGYGTLDGIRATEQLIKVAPATTPVGMVGSSGGAIASMWAAEEQPVYAPELHA